MEASSVLLEKMTLEEKAALLEGYQSWMTNAIPRLEIPAIHLTDGPVGVRKKRTDAGAGATGLGLSMPSTAFPTSVSIANGWNLENAEKMGEAIGKEAIGYDVQVLLGPAMNLKRDPRCGRNFEYYSEDPLLAGKMAAAFVRGVQSTGTAACPKHFALIRSLKAQGKKVIAVLYSGCAVIVEEWKQYADAIVMNYYSGCEGGTALANLLCGDKNFSGKLPFTVAKDEKDYPPIIGIGEKPYTIEYGYYHGYTKMDKEGIEPAYPFGYGLSYTTFTIKNVLLRESKDCYTINALVENTGKIAGAEVIQIYAASCGASDGSDRPIKLLKGFRRVALNAGETAEVSIDIQKNELRFWVNGDWKLDATYQFYIGTNSRDVTLIEKLS